MPDKKKFLLRIDDKIYAALEKWAADDFRSINAQIEFLLKESLRKNGRLLTGDEGSVNNGSNNPD